jgi:GNAT superfamily N-acetyltransferase
VRIRLGAANDAHQEVRGPMLDITIRPLAPEDRAQWEPLWQGYLAFYKAGVPDEVTDITFARFFDHAEPMHALVAERDGEIVGMVHYIFHCSTWTKGPYCYLQDLFVREDVRGGGVGRELIEAVYERAKAQGASRVYWLTQEDNATARALYDKLAERSGFIQYRKLF